MACRKVGGVGTGVRRGARDKLSAKERVGRNESCREEQKDKVDGGGKLDGGVVVNIIGYTLFE